MFSSPNIQNRQNEMSPMHAGVEPIPFSGGVMTNHEADSIHLTLKKQRIDQNFEAPRQVLISTEEELLDYSAVNERASLQMTPKCFKRDTYLKVDRASTGRKWGYLKASSESKKNLVSLFNTGAPALTGSFEKNRPGLHNID